MGDKQRSTIEMIQNLRTEKLSVREELALNLAYYSRAYGLSQTDLCERTGIPKSTMSQYFSGARYPRPAQLEALAGCFGITVGQLVGSTPPEDERIDDLPIELRIIAREGRMLTKEQRQSLLRYCRYMYPEVYSRGEDE